MVVEGTRIERSEPVPPAAREQEDRVLRAEHPYSWLEDYLARLDGKEARGEYYAWLE